jgi:hypothetical protein
MRVPHQQIDHLLSVALMGRQGKTALKKGSACVFQLLFDSHQVMVLVWPELGIGGICERLTTEKKRFFE